MNTETLEIVIALEEAKTEATRNKLVASEVRSAMAIMGEDFNAEYLADALGILLQKYDEAMDSLISVTDELIKLKKKGC